MVLCTTCNRRKSKHTDQPCEHCEQRLRASRHLHHHSFLQQISPIARGNCVTKPSMVVSATERADLEEIGPFIFSKVNAQGGQFLTSAPAVTNSGTGGVP